MIMKGQKISDRYQIIKAIGEGGMANVYLAYDTILDRNVAVKVLRGDLATDEKFVRRFQREALSASSLSHPNIVEVYDVGEDNNQYYIVMEYIEGKHLKELLKKRGKLTLSEVIDIMLQITDGMSVAHDAYIIHRDIKPQNIMIQENGVVKITDFGIAMAMNATQLTQTNSVMGSVHYLPPEQANGKGSTLQSDIYSMGILMYELLTGKLPYKGDNAVEIALKHLKESLPSIKEDLPDLPQSIENIIIRSSSKNPKNRYADAREMHEDLLTCLDDSRKNEPKITLEYPENIDESSKSKRSNSSKKEEKVIEKEPKKESGEEPIAKQITKSDLKKQNKFLIVLAAIFTGLVVIITSVVLLIPALTKQKELIIPDVAGLTEEEAVKKLQEEGFQVKDETETVSSSEIEEGLVVKTNPIIGSKRIKGTEVTLYISEGDAKITVENYVGQDFNYVKGLLEGKGIRVLEEKRATDDENAESGKIIGQSVEEGEKLAAGDFITLYIPNIDKYPDFTDGSYTADSVKDYLKDYNVSVSVIEKEDTTHTKGSIIYQSRKAGDPIVRGASITIHVAVEPKTDDDEDKTDEPICTTPGLDC
ncbi:MAG: Stk1 family PASTA domain-containing Ser/Thr kinase [Bacilli bacterium]|nr:Stk1 family PASTA domain-containing Ser/Thr kinase [Bacilli bacterium]